MSCLSSEEQLQSASLIVGVTVSVEREGRREYKRERGCEGERERGGM